MPSSFVVRDLGSVPYAECADLQRALLEDVADGREPDTLLFVEHPPVLTLGANFHVENLLHPVGWYEERGIEVHSTERGGDVTYHGPGQLVAYPIFDVSRHGKDLHRWLRDLEETVIQVVSEYGLSARRFPPHTGVWVDDAKVCAMGIKVRRWVSMHGLALNCDVDLGPFSTIVPCGIQGYPVTSLTLLSGRTVGTGEVRPKLAAAFERTFGAARA